MFEGAEGRKNGKKCAPPSIEKPLWPEIDNNAYSSLRAVHHQLASFLPSTGEGPQHREEKLLPYWVKCFAYARLEIAL